MESEFNYALERELNYSRDGDPHTVAEFITLKEPTSAHLSEVSRIRQAIQKASMKVSESVQAEDAPDPQGDGEESAHIDGAEIMALIGVYGDSLDKFCQDVRSIIVSKGVALVDGDIALTKTIAERVPARDMEGMIGEYVAHFFLS